MIYTSNYLEQEMPRVEKLINKIGAGQNRTLLLDMIMAGGNIIQAESEYFQWKIEETENLEEAMYAGVMEGAEYGKSGADPKRRLLKNNCQIFKQVAEISGTAMALNPDGINNHLEKRVEEKLILIKRALNKAILEGTLQNEDVSQSKPRKMNGLLNIIANTKDLENNKNLIVVCVILTVGVSGIFLFDTAFAGVSLAMVLGVILNLILRDKRVS